MKKYLWTLALAVIAIFLMSFFNIFFFGDWEILAFSILGGATAAWSISEERVGRFMGLQAVSGVLYGLIALLGNEIWNVLLSPPPFDYIKVAAYGLIFAFCFFIGSLAGYIIKGSISLARSSAIKKNKK